MAGSDGNPDLLDTIEDRSAFLAVPVLLGKGRGGFSPPALFMPLLPFSEYFNRTLARPYRWTYQGRPLTA